MEKINKRFKKRKINGKMKDTFFHKNQRHILPNTFKVVCGYWYVVSLEGKRIVDVQLSPMTFKKHSEGYIMRYMEDVILLKDQKVSINEGKLIDPNFSDLSPLVKKRIKEFSNGILNKI
jgi:hypothetical protein